jgi:adenosylcobinamide-GDP ribazoletransferase
VSAWLPLLRSAQSTAGAKLAPVLGALIGVCSGAVYWLSVQLWPASVAVILSMAATALLIAGLRGALPAGRGDLWVRLFCLLAKYSALMALSAAKLPFVVPANLALGVVMVCGHAASYALAVSGTATRPGAAKVTNTDLGLAWLLGLTPAALLGIPGLTGLVCAIAVSIGFIAYLKIAHSRHSGDRYSGDRFELTQQLTETGFYLGALATWSYV